jgi:polysaccharide biosynthesis transport protein
VEAGTIVDVTKASEGGAESPEFAEPADQPISVSIRRYWHILLKRRWLILGVVAVVVTGAAVVTFRQTRIYQARVSLIVDVAAPQVLGTTVREVVDLGASNYWMSRDYLASQSDIIKSRDLALRVVDQLNLMDVREFWPPGLPRSARTKDAAADRIMASIQVTNPRENRIIEVYVAHWDPQMAARLCNGVAEAYLAFNLDHKHGSAKDAVKWLSDQLDDLRKELNQSELALHEFKKQNNVLSVPMEDKANLLTKRIDKLSDHVTEIQMKRVELGAKRKQMLALRSEDPLKADSSAVMNETPMMAELRKGYAEEYRKLIDLKTRYLENHPLVRAQQGKLDASLQHLRREIDNSLQVNEARYSAVVDAERNLASAVEVAKKEALDLNLRQIDYNRLRRHQENTEKLYGVVLSRMKESDLSANLRTSNIRLLDRATIPKAPVSPRVQINLLLALAFGLLAGILLAVLIESLDTTVKSQAEVEAISGLPFLGILPSIQQAQNFIRQGNGVVDPRKDLYLHTNPKSAVAECARSIRTNLLFMAPDRPLTSLVVTSPGPREGKTTTAISMAIAMAQGGERVLLVDTDLRRPRVHRTFGVSGEVGFTAVMLGQSSLTDAVKTTEVPNLYVLPCGKQPPNPAELLNTVRFGALLDEMRAHYDRIILDSPPVVAVTDAAVLGARADGVLVVVKALQTAREGLRHTVRVLGDVGAHVLGCVLNDLDLENRTYGQYYYYYTQRYGYGYHETEKPADGRA